MVYITLLLYRMSSSTATLGLTTVYGIKLYTGNSILHECLENYLILH